MAKEVLTPFQKVVLEVLSIVVTHIQSAYAEEKERNKAPWKEYIYQDCHKVLGKISLLK